MTSETAKLTPNEQIEHISRRLDHYRIHEFFAEVERLEKQAQEIKV